MPILDIPEKDRPGIVLIRDLPEKSFAELLVELERSPEDVPSIDGVRTEDAALMFRSLKTMYRVRLYADVPVDVFVGDALDSLLEYGSITASDVKNLGERLNRVLDIDSFSLASKASLLQLEHEHRYCTARMLTDIRPVFGANPAEAPQAMMINHVLRITYHQDEETTKEIYFALRRHDLTELRGLIDRAEIKEQNLRKVLSVTKAKLLDAPEE